MPFVSSEIMVSLPSLTANQLDELDFGCVKVNDKGLVEMYNLWESEFAGVPQETAMGRNFFRELAPCTNNRLIFGRFKEGVEQDNLNTIVSYAFTYKMRPTLVKVHLYRDPATKTNWVLVQKHDARPAK
jgi:photoactive yellow protein